MNPVGTVGSSWETLPMAGSPGGRAEPGASKGVFGIYESLVPFKKDSRPQVLWRGSLYGAKTQGRRKVHFGEGPSFPLRGQIRGSLTPCPMWGLGTSL